MSTLSLVATGTGMGIVHVLTGPDHLSAIATLTANSPQKRAFWYGARWGIGHSIGLVVVGAAFIFISSRSDQSPQNENEVVHVPERMETMGEVFVGLFMLLLGTHSLVRTCGGLRRNDTAEEIEMMQGDSVILQSSSALGERTHDRIALKWGVGVRSREQSARSMMSVDTTHSLRPTVIDVEEEGAVVVPLNIGGESFSVSDARDAFKSKSVQLGGDTPDGYNFGLGHADYPFDGDHDDGISSKACWSIVIGIVHGIAGPGGVLGVIPAVQLHNAWLAMVYLGTFCITSTLAMGCFAAGYGLCSSRISASNQTIRFRMEVFSASLSIFVGCMWLTLIWLGKLHNVFP